MAKPKAEVELEVGAEVAAPEFVFVRAVYGEMRHLFTNVLFTCDPKKVELDGFLQAQIDAGKLEVVQP